jgi:hypothetical protein
MNSLRSDPRYGELVCNARGSLCLWGRVCRGNAFDFSRDLSSIVYSRPGGEADIYLLSQAP